MFIQVTCDSEAGSASLEEPDDVRSFKVVIQARCAEDKVAQALMPIGRLVDREKAFIKPDAIRRLARGRVAADWGQSLDGMIRYADSKGWIDPESGEIQAHCEWQ